MTTLAPLRRTGLLACLLALGCPSDPAPEPEPGPDPDELGPLTATLRHVLPDRELAAGVDEIVCASWTLDNEAPLYVSAIRQDNGGGFHHGNWFVVPADVYPGEDGYWDCSERGFEEIPAALSGTILFAQSTQARSEEQRFAEGAVVKIPPRSKIVADIHLLNPSPRAVTGQLWLTMELVHPVLVQSVLSPVLLSYLDLQTPGEARSRHTTRCGTDPTLEDPSVFLTWPAMTVHYVLPHFHGFADYFALSVVGGELDGTPLLELEGFSAEPLGHTFDPPLELADATGLSISCGYDNWGPEELSWGLGDGEMCLMLALVDAPFVIIGGAREGSTLLDVVDEVRMFEAPCEWTVVSKGLAHSLPPAYELDVPLYVPPGADDPDVPPPPSCTEVDPLAEAAGPATLEAVRQYVFQPSCSFSSCHGQARAGGLDLRATDLHTELVAHAMQRPVDRPLVVPGDPDGSYLLEVLSRCEPEGGVSMPANSATLLDDEVVAIVRDWIAAGAPPEG